MRKGKKANFSNAKREHRELCSFLRIKFVVFELLTPGETKLNLTGTF